MLSHSRVSLQTAMLVTIATAATAVANAGTFDPPALSEFMIPKEREIALARSAAPDRVSQDATIMVLGQEGYETAVEGSNGFVCLVLRSWGNPSYDHYYIYDPRVIVPECLDENAVKTILPLQLLRAKLGTNMTPPDAIEVAVKEAFRSGRLQRTKTVSFGYMMSAEMKFDADHHGPAHIMIYVPDSYSNDTIGGFPYKEKFVIVEGGSDEPYTAANIYLTEKAIEPKY